MYVFSVYFSQVIYVVKSFSKTLGAYVDEKSKLIPKMETTI
jgi:hypothetical protein